MAVRISKKKNVRGVAILIFMGCFLLITMIFNTSSLYGVVSSRAIDFSGMFTKNNDDEPRQHTSDFVRANNTIITAYFPLPTNSRHTSGFYVIQLERLFSNNDAMIIFTSPELVKDISNLRGKPERTLVIPVNLTNETHSARLDPEYWKRLNAPREYQNVPKEVWWVWNEKFEFLKRGADLNPFQSNFFAWFDAGLIRWDRYTNTTLIQRIPPELSHDRFMVLNVTRITSMKKKAIMMGAGLFGGYKPAVDKYHKRYYEVFSESYNNGSDILRSEQHVMYKTCVTTPGLCFSVRPEMRKGHPIEPVEYAMFYLLPFLNTQEYEILKRQGLIQNQFGDFSPP